jgi:hypothetical protein
MASRKRRKPRTDRRRASAPVLPRPLDPYRSGVASLDEVILPLLAHAEPGAERAVDLERARLRLLRAPEPGDAPHLVALLGGAALDLGVLPPPPDPADKRRPPAQRREIRRRWEAASEARRGRLAYLGLLFAAATLHEASQRRLAELLRAPLDPEIKGRLAFSLGESAAPLSADLEAALLAGLDAPGEEGLPFVGHASRALFRHLSPERACAALAPRFEPAALAARGGVQRAAMILTDLDTSRLAPAWRPIFGRLLRVPPLAGFAGDALVTLPADPSDLPLALEILEDQLARGPYLDGYVVSLLARSAVPSSVPMLLRLLEGLDPDWQTLFAGLERAADATVVPAIEAWVKRHAARTGRKSDWEGFVSARKLIDKLKSAR